MKKNKQLITIAILGIAGYFVYKFIKNKIDQSTPMLNEPIDQNTAATTTSTTTTAAPSRSLKYTETITDFIRKVAKTGLVNAFSVDATALNVRKSPTTSSQIITKLPKDVIVGASSYILTTKVPTGWKVIIFPEYYKGVKIRGGFISDKYITDQGKLYGN